MHRIGTARTEEENAFSEYRAPEAGIPPNFIIFAVQVRSCLLYTSDAADD